MPQDYVGYSPWTDAAAYGQGLGQSLGQALINMPQQRMQIAAGIAQMGARQAQQQQLLQMRQLQMEQAEDLRKVQMQEALARTSAAQAQLGKTQQQPQIKPKDTVEIIKGEGGVPIGYFDYTEKKYIPFGSGSGPTNTGGFGGPAPTPNQQLHDLGGLMNTFITARQNGMDTNAPTLFNNLSNVLSGLGQKMLAPTQQQAPQLGVPPTNAPAPFQLSPTNQSPSPGLRFVRDASGNLVPAP
jgi:hypothetical protein